MSTKKGYVVPSTMTFEKALSRLDSLVAEMDSGELSLDKMISYFEEGQALIKFCSTKLNEVEQKVEILVGKGSDAQAEPFDSELPDPEGDDELF